MSVAEFACPECGYNRFHLGLDAGRDMTALEFVANGAHPAVADLAAPEGLLVLCARPACTFRSAADEVLFALEAVARG